jgi:peptide/nickel transport system ATP-binding protein
MLLDAIPDFEMTGRARTTFAGEVPNPLNPPSGCTFHPRCPHANARCRSAVPKLQFVRLAEVASQVDEEGRL